METVSAEPRRIAGRYEIIDTIASGGMAIVYRGWDYYTDRYVAIKAMRIMQTEQLDPLATQRFRREAQAAASVVHPNIVLIYDFIENEEGQFLIMEYVDGINLKRFIQDYGTISAARTLAIVEQICSALSVLHARGIVHRDIKPQNILLTQEGRVRLTDFGIVHVSDTNELTRTGIVLGTADYLSPEQARGDPLTYASDVYSLGIVTYEMLSGLLPFKGSTPISVAMQHANKPVPSIRLVNPDISPAIDAILQQATAKDPRKRFKSAAMMARTVRFCRQRLVASSADLLQASQEPVPMRRAWQWVTRRLTRGA